jgi:hypothetical protein
MIGIGWQYPWKCVRAAGLAFAGLASTVLASEPDRLVHRFLAIAVSPDGSAVASVEGDVPVSGFEPTVRDLVIRRRQLWRLHDHVGGDPNEPFQGWGG